MERDVPLSHSRTSVIYLEVSADIVERVDPIFYGDPLTVAIKALGMT